MSLLPGCGSEAPSDPGPPVSGVVHRLLLANEFFQNISVIDADRDQGTGFGISISGRPAIMVGTSTKTAVYDSQGNSVSLIDNATESVTAWLPLENPTESIVMRSDSQRVYAAVRNSSKIQVLDVVNGTVLASIPAPAQVRRLAISPNGTKLLAFADNSDAVFIIDPSNPNTLITVPIGAGTRPFTAVFGSDNNRAFVLNCGAECGGTAASVTVLDLTNNGIAGSVTVGGATVAVIDGSTLYVAGTNGAAGELTVINTGSLSVTRTVAIGDGLHTNMGLGSNGKLYIGARDCTTGCLWVHATSGTTARNVGVTAQDTPDNNRVTAIEPITSRNVVYVIHGGNLRIYDTATDTLQSRQIDVTGSLSVMKEIE